MTIRKILFLLSNDEIISPSSWASLFCFQFFFKNSCIASLRKYFLRKNGGKRDRPNGGVIVLSLLGILLVNCSSFAQNLDNKVFIIQSKGAKAKGRVIEADYNNLGKNGAKVHLWEIQNALHQTWKFKALFDGINLYYIINQSPKAGKSKYLEAAWATLGLDGGKIQLWEFNDGVNKRYGANQVWQVLKNSDGSYSIFSAHPRSNGKALEAESFTQQNNGGKVHLYFDVKKQNQTWNLLEDT